MNKEEQQYLDIMQKILDEGDERIDRTGVGTKAIFGTQMRFDLSKSFPLLTTKRVWFKGVVHELLWMLSGSTNIQYLKDNNVNIWNEWADENGDLGPVYGKQWRRWMAASCADHGDDCDKWSMLEEDGLPKQCGGHWELDQIAQVIGSIKSSPYSRRHIVSAWNVGDLDEMALAPCHAFFQFFVSNGKLSCQLYQRSCDWLLGIPFNVASYSLLTHMIAHVTGLEVGEFIHTGGDVHLYLNHLDQVKEQLTRVPYEFPQIELAPGIKSIDDFTFDDIRLIDYKSHPTIKAPIAV